MSKTVQLNIVNALERIGRTNGTSLPEVQPPEDINDKDAWQKDREASFELLVSQQIASYAEKRVEKAKSGVRQTFNEEIAKISPGTSNTIVRGNMALNIEVRKPPSRLDKALLSSALLKRGMSTEEVDKIIEEGSASTKAPTYY